MMDQDMDLEVGLSGALRWSTLEDRNMCWRLPLGSSEHSHSRFSWLPHNDAFRCLLYFLVIGSLRSLDDLSILPPSCYVRIACS